MSVPDEVEYRRAMESGWRESAQEAVDHVLARDKAEGDATAERLYQDRNMGELATREAEMVTREAGGEHQPEITGRKVKEARERKRAR